MMWLGTNIKIDKCSFVIWRYFGFNKMPSGSWSCLPQSSLKHHNTDWGLWVERRVEKEMCEGEVVTLGRSWSQQVSREQCRGCNSPYLHSTSLLWPPPSIALWTYLHPTLPTSLHLHPALFYGPLPSLASLLSDHIFTTVWQSCISFPAIKFSSWIGNSAKSLSLHPNGKIGGV